MREKIFEIGATVRLKSGGPLMVIEAPSGSSWSCQWFDAVGRLRAGVFRDEVLNREEPKEEES